MQSTDDLLTQVEELKSRLAEAEQLIEAIKAGEVDAFAVSKNNNAEIFTLHSGDYAYRVLVENFIEGAVNLSEDGLIVYTNTSFHKTLNLGYENVIGQDIFQFIHADSKVAFSKLFKKGLAGHSKGEVNLVAGDSIIPVYVSFTSLYPTLATVGVVVSDLRERKMHEQTLLQKKQLEISKKTAEDSEKRYNMMLMQSPFAFAVFSGKELIITLANDRMKQVLGKGDDIENRPLLTILPELINQPFPGYMQKVLETGIPFHANETLAKLYRNGRMEDGYFNFVYQPYREVDGSVSGVTCIAYEVTNEVIARQKIEESEAKFRIMAESSDILIGVNNETVDAVYFNKTWEKLTGRSVEDLLHLGWADLLHPEDKEPFMNKFLTAFKNKASYDGEFRILNKDGGYSWLYSKAQVRLHPDGSYAGHISSSIDITERKQGEKALKESEAKYRTLFETMDQGFGIVELIFDKNNLPVDYLFIEVNPVFEKQTGLKDATGKHVKELMPDLEQHWLEIYGNVAKTGKSIQFTEWSEQLRRWYDVYAFSVGGDGSNRVAILFTDVTQRKKAEEIIRESEQRFRALVNATSDVVYRMNDDWSEMRYLEGRGFLSDTGEPIKGWLQKNIHPLDQERVQNVIAEAIRTKTIFELEYQVVQADGTTGWTFSRAVPVFDTNGNIIEWFGAAGDVTERKRAEAALKESELYFRRLTDTVPTIIWITEPDGYCSYLNKNWYDYTGQTEKEGEGYGWLTATHPDDAPAAGEAFVNANTLQKPFDHVYRLKTRKGEYRWAIDRGTPKYGPDGKYEGMIGTVVDIHDEKLAQEKIKESDAFNRSVLENSPDCVNIIDAGGDIQYMNTNGLSIMEIDDFGAIIGTPWAKLWGAANQQTAEGAVTLAMNGKTAQFQAFCRGAKGTPRWWDIMVSPVLDPTNNTVTTIISVARDITSQRETQALMEYRKALLEAHNEASFDGILLVDAKGKIISYNHKFVEVWNMPEHITAAKDDEAALGFAMAQLVNPHQFIEKVKYLYEHPTETSNDILEFKDGKIIERHGYPVVADDGTYYAWSWTFRDITEQKQAELKLIESEKKLRKTTDHFEIATTAAAVGTWSLDLSSKTLTWSGLHKKMWGYDEHRTDLLYEDWYKIILPGDKEDAFAEVEKALKTKTLYEAFYRIKRPDNGTIRWILSTGQYFYNEAGEAVTLTGVSMDITEQKQAEIALKESEKRFRLLAELVPAKISNAAADGSLIYFNQNWLDYTGFSLEELKDFGYYKIMHPDEVDKFRELFQQAAAAGTVLEMEMRFLNKQGQYKWHLNLASPVKDETGNIKMWIGATIDIQKIKEEEQRKGDFIKLASHELKTPVTSIKGYVQFLLGLLKNDPGTNTILMPVKSSLVRIDIQIARLTRLITEMLDLSRIESGKLELQKKRFSLNELVTETIQDVSHTTTTHTIALQDECACEIIADRDRLGQVLINFITNAVKYSPESSTVTVRIFSAGRNAVGVSVKDFGIGISKDEQSRIFERFYRVEGKREDIFSGFGIGLFIANEIIQKHQGTINVESDIGKGAVFTFILPLNI